MKEIHAKQAELMRTRSKKYLPEVSIGDYVTLAVPDVDRGITDSPSLLCRVVDIDYKHSLYELACEAGVLETLFARNCFDLAGSDLNLNVRLDTKLSVRSAVSSISIGGGQGMVKCNCTSSCATNRCGCKRGNFLCNSRCHGGNSGCKNK